MTLSRPQLAFRALSLCLILHTASEGQTLPAVTADSGQFRMHPLVPAAGEPIRLSATGEFAFSNAVISVDSFSVEPELVTIDLGTAWNAGSSAAADAVTTPWSFEVELGALAQGVSDVWIRVNGETFLFSFTIVEAARPDPPPLSDPVPTVTPSRSLGMNLNTLKDGSTMFTFVDVFKASRAWIPHRPSDDTWDTGEAIDVDEWGWVRSLAPDQEAGTLMMTGVGNAYPGGRWTALYDGEGELVFDWDARIIDSEPGRLELWVTPDIGMHVIIRETNPADYIRNIRVITPGFEETYEEEPFHPTYVDFLRQFSVLRFMDWADSNEPENNVPEVGEWSARITTNHATQGTVRGVSFEYMIRMANDVGADPWINVPIVATDDYVDSLATLIRDSLNADRKVYVELSNEVWNPSFPQHAVAAGQGALLGLADQTAADPYRFIFPPMASSFSTPCGTIPSARLRSSRSSSGSSAHGTAWCGSSEDGFRTASSWRRRLRTIFSTGSRHPPKPTRTPGHSISGRFSHRRRAGSMWRQCLPRRSSIQRLPICGSCSTSARV